VPQYRRADRSGVGQTCTWTNCSTRRTKVAKSPR
jgi:hypothetical protein